jgi:hypothetical protein
MLICIDLSRLYFAVRSLNILLDYEALLDVLEERFSDEVEIIGFTTADPGNTKQAKFIERLTEMDVLVKVYPADSQPSFTAEIAVEVARHDMMDVLVVSNDAGFLRVFDLLREGGKRPGLCFFSDRLDVAWNPAIISGAIPFTDLSDPMIRKSITR